jgi:pre-mRNA-splicing factor 38A
VYYFDFGRWVLEASGTLEPRRSALEDDFEEEEDKEEQPMEIDEPNGLESVSALYN